MAVRRREWIRTLVPNEFVRLLLTKSYMDALKISKIIPYSTKYIPCFLICNITSITLPYSWESCWIEVCYEDSIVDTFLVKNKSDIPKYVLVPCARLPSSEESFIRMNLVVGKVRRASLSIPGDDLLASRIEYRESLDNPNFILREYAFTNKTNEKYLISMNLMLQTRNFVEVVPKFLSFDSLENTRMTAIESLSSPILRYCLQSHSFLSVSDLMDMSLYFQSVLSNSYIDLSRNSDVIEFIRSDKYLSMIQQSQSNLCSEIIVLDKSAGKNADPLDELDDSKSILEAYSFYRESIAQNRWITFYNLPSSSSIPSIATKSSFDFTISIFSLSGFIYSFGFVQLSEYISFLVSIFKMSRKEDCDSVFSARFRYLEFFSLHSIDDISEEYSVDVMFESSSENIFDESNTSRMFLKFVSPIEDLPQAINLSEIVMLEVSHSFVAPIDCILDIAVDSIRGNIHPQDCELGNLYLELCDVYNHSSASKMISSNVHILRPLSISSEKNGMQTILFQGDMASGAKPSVQFATNSSLLDQIKGGGFQSGFLIRAYGCNYAIDYHSHCLGYSYVVPSASFDSIDDLKIPLSSPANYTLKLTVTIGKDLVAVNLTEKSSDPYFLVYFQDFEGNIITPHAPIVEKNSIFSKIKLTGKNKSQLDSSCFYKSQIKKGDVNPLWNETILIDSTTTPLMYAHSILIELWDDNNVTSDVCLGHVSIPIHPQYPSNAASLGNNITQSGLEQSFPVSFSPKMSSKYRDMNLGYLFLSCSWVENNTVPTVSSEVSTTINKLPLNLFDIRYPCFFLGIGNDILDQKHSFSISFLVDCILIKSVEPLSETTSSFFSQCLEYCGGTGDAVICIPYLKLDKRCVYALTPSMLLIELELTRLFVSQKSVKGSLSSSQKISQLVIVGPILASEMEINILERIHSNSNVQFFHHSLQNGMSDALSVDDCFSNCQIFLDRILECENNISILNSFIDTNTVDSFAKDLIAQEIGFTLKSSVRIKLCLVTILMKMTENNGFLQDGDDFDVNVSSLLNDTEIIDSGDFESIRLKYSISMLRFALKSLVDVAFAAANNCCDIYNDFQEDLSIGISKIINEKYTETIQSLVLYFNDQKANSMTPQQQLTVLQVVLSLDNIFYVSFGPILSLFQMSFSNSPLLSNSLNFSDILQKFSVLLDIEMEKWRKSCMNVGSSDVSLLPSATNGDSYKVKLWELQKIDVDHVDMKVRKGMVISCFPRDIHQQILTEIELKIITPHPEWQRKFVLIARRLNTSVAASVSKTYRDLTGEIRANAVQLSDCMLNIAKIAQPVSLGRSYTGLYVRKRVKNLFSRGSLSLPNTAPQQDISELYPGLNRGYEYLAAIINDLYLIQGSYIPESIERLIKFISCGNRQDGEKSTSILGTYAQHLLKNINDIEIEGIFVDTKREVFNSIQYVSEILVNTALLESRDLFLGSFGILGDTGSPSSPTVSSFKLPFRLPSRDSSSKSSPSNSNKQNSAPDDLNTSEGIAICEDNCNLSELMSNIWVIFESLLSQLSPEVHISIVQLCCRKLCMRYVIYLRDLLLTRQKSNQQILMTAAKSPNSAKSNTNDSLIRGFAQSLFSRLELQFSEDEMNEPVASVGATLVPWTDYEITLLFSDMNCLVTRIVDILQLSCLDFSMNDVLRVLESLHVHRLCKLVVDILLSSKLDTALELILNTFTIFGNSVREI